MTREREPVDGAPSGEPNENTEPQDGLPTLRSMPHAPVLDANEVYVEPQPLPKVSKHKTFELDTVKLAAEIDPRKRPTELKLGRVRRPPSAAPLAELPSAPPEGVVASAAARSSAGKHGNRNALAIVALLVACVAAFAIARSLRSRLPVPAPGALAASVASVASGDADLRARSSAAASVASAANAALMAAAASARNVGVASEPIAAPPEAPQPAASASEPAAPAPSAHAPPVASTPIAARAGATATIVPLASLPEVTEKSTPRPAKPQAKHSDGTTSPHDAKPKHSIY